MSGSLTAYGREQLLRARFMPATAAMPANLYLAYTRIAPTLNMDGSELDEPLTGYDRALIGPPDDTCWDFSGFSEVYNIVVITFDDPTADWGLMGGWAVTDDPDVNQGNCWAVGEIIEPYTVDNGDAGPVVDIAGLAIGIYD